MEFYFYPFQHCEKDNYNISLLIISKRHKIKSLSLEKNPGLSSAVSKASNNSLTADPGVASSIPTLSHTFAEIDHEIIFTAFLLQSADSRWVVVSYN